MTKLNTAIVVSLSLVSMVPARAQVAPDSVPEKAAPQATVDIFGEYLKRKSEWLKDKNESPETQKEILDFVEEHGGDVESLRKLMKHIDETHVQPQLRSGSQRPEYTSIFRYAGDSVATELFRGKKLLENLRLADVEALKNAIWVSNSMTFKSPLNVHEHEIVIMERGLRLLETAHSNDKVAISRILKSELDSAWARMKNDPDGSDQGIVSARDLMRQRLLELNFRLDRATRPAPLLDGVKHDAPARQEPVAEAVGQKDAKVAPTCKTDDVLKSLRDLARVLPDLKKVIGDVAMCNVDTLDPSTAENTKKLLEAIQTRLDEAKKAVGAQSAK